MMLYRYMKAEHALLSIRSAALRVGSVMDFNDPFEFAYEQTINRQALSEFQKRVQSEPGLRDALQADGCDPKSMLDLTEDEIRCGAELPPELIEQAPPDGLREHVHKWFGVLCFSQIDNSKLMWSHYADSHRGIVLAFDVGPPTADSIHAVFPRCDTLMRMQYSCEAPQFSVVSKYVSDDWQGEFRRAIQLKHSDWAYEQEVRALIAWEDTETAPSGAVVTKFDVGGLAAIILGCKICDEHRSQVVEYVREHPHIRLGRCWRGAGYRLSVVFTQ